MLHPTSARRLTRAFTMVELIVVIVVLGIIALIAIPTYQSVVVRTRKAATLATAQAFARDVQIFAALHEYDSFPPAEARVKYELLAVGGVEAGTPAAGDPLRDELPSNVTRISGSSSTDGVVIIRTGGYKVPVTFHPGASATFGDVVPGP